MSSRDLKRIANLRLKSLSPERLRVAVDFLAYLEERESNEATDELLRIPGLKEELQKAKNSRAKTVNWRRVKKDV